jgi:NDP-sugar pyrophosphorylase family protein
VPYGVIESDGAQITAVKEKPDIKLFVNAGIYLLEPSVYKCIPEQEHFNMTDVVERLLQANRTVVSFPIREYWMDIGQHNDYEQAQKDFGKESAEV